MMKKRNIPGYYASFLLTNFLLTGFLLTGLLLGGCRQLTLETPELQNLPPGMGILSVSLLKEGRSAAESGRTMLAIDPDFTGYGLEISPDPETGTGSKTYSSSTGSFQITLPNGAYFVSAAGYTGDKKSAKTQDPSPVSISAGSQTDVPLKLYPYMDDAVYGTLQYSLNWAVNQIPARAELLVEQFDTEGNLNPIPISFINNSITAGHQRGTILIVQRETGLVQQSGYLELPPGEYKLTTSVTMDGPNPPVSRTDIAHIFSNLITPAAFFYGAGDLALTSPGTDGGSGFITRFNFIQTPGAASIVGSGPGPDGTRLIMVMVPPGTNLTRLTPTVECAEGAFIASPPPLPDPGPDGKPLWDTGDYSRPTSWIAEGRNGVTQQYTVVVTEVAADDCFITDIAFRQTRLESAPDIDQSAGTITVVVPYGTLAAYPNYTLTPVFSYVGREVKLASSTDSGNPSADSALSGSIQFQTEPPPASARRIFRVYAQDGQTKLYTVTIQEALDSEAEITKFVFDGYPDRAGVINQSNRTIRVTLPYGANLDSLKPLISYKGRLNPASGVEHNFNAPVVYTVTPENNSTPKTYTVTVETELANRDTGIFDFVITNVPRAKVVIGTKPRTDGKIPIVVSVPYATSPLTPDGTKTDLMKLVPRITLSSGSSRFVNTGGTEISPPNGTTDVIPFGNQDDYQEAVYRIKAQAGNIQDYVVVVARDVHYYYVSASGNDTDPDQYNGGSESIPFKTLAHAVYQAVKHNVDHIYVIGTLNDTSEGGAWENTSDTQMGQNGTFRPSGGPQTGGGASVFNLNGTGRNGNSSWPIYITGIGSNAVLQGTSGKRVISVSGNARIIFDNITIRDGGGTSYSGNGGGMYIGSGSWVTWKSGVITGSRARSGGGVYVDNGELDFMTGSINGNTAAGSTAPTGFTANSSSLGIDGGGGVYINGENGQFWLANGEIANNTALSGSGGGVLVNASLIPNSPTQDNMPHNFIMSGGSVSGNNSKGAVWPHGGGGVFVAKGSFEMMNGRIVSNTSTRQGGGVFVWSKALFYMDGDSAVTGNSGVGSAKAICSRGITTLRGHAQADSSYIWNYAKGSWNNGFGDEFTLMEGARVSALVLAFADDPQDNRNYINLEVDPVSGAFFTGGTEPITTIDLESRLNASSAFSATATIDGDWLNRYMVKNGGNPIPQNVLNRFPLGTFTSGGPSRSVSTSYKLDTTGKLAAKP
jgi:hypothetical protein